jgi:integrase
MACSIPMAWSSTRWRTTQLSCAVALAVRAASSRAKVEYADPDPDGLVFTTPTGAHLLRSPFNRFVWRPGVEQVGPDGLRVHDLRHTAATLAAAAGATTKELMERMGHTSPAVALRYQHVMADRQARPASPWTIWPGPRVSRRRAWPGHVRARRGHGGAGRGVDSMAAGL